MEFETLTPEKAKANIEMVKRQLPYMTKASHENLSLLSEYCYLVERSATIFDEDNVLAYVKITIKKELSITKRKFTASNYEDLRRQLCKDLGLTP